MAEPNADNQALLARIDEMTETIVSLQADLASQKNKDFEAKIAKLEADLSARNSSIASLNTQVETFQLAATQANERADVAEQARVAIVGEIATIRAEQTSARRLADMIGKGAEAAVAAGLNEKLANLDEAQFTATVEVLSAAWKQKTAPTPTPAPRADSVTAIDQATLEPEPSLAVSGLADEASTETIRTFFSQHFGQGRRGRTAE